MHKNKTIQKLMTVMLSIIMAVGMIPVSVSAETDEVPDSLSKEITAFAELAADIAAQSVPLSTSKADLNLPETLRATVRPIASEDGDVTDYSETSSEADDSTNATSSTAIDIVESDVQTLDIQVTWEAVPSYSPETSGTYVFHPVCPQDYIIKEDLSLPIITVTVGVQSVMPTETGPTSQITFMDRFDKEETVTATKLTNSTTELPDGWYYATGNLCINSTLTVTGNAQIILTDGCNLTVTSSHTPSHNGAGINVWAGDYFTPKRSLTIYAQSEGTGTLNAYGDVNGAGIGGGTCQSAGNITIVGGTVNAYGKDEGAGIGGGQFGTGATVTIYGGTINAVGGKQTAAGIGGGTRGSGNKVYIHGGTINATGGNNGAGIGGGDFYNGGDVYIYGGTVNAAGGTYGAGIGGGYGGNGGNVIIDGGTVRAVGGSYGGKDIGGGWGLSPTLDGSIKNSHCENVYLNVLTLPDKANTPITDGSINNVTCVKSFNSLDPFHNYNNKAYGIKDVKTNSNSKLYFYLLASDDKELVSLTADNNTHHAIYSRGTTTVNETLYTSPHTWDDVQTFLDYMDEVTLDFSNFTTPENGMLYTFDVGSNKTVTLKGNGTQIKNIAFIFNESNNITIENINIMSADLNTGSNSSKKCYTPLYFTGKNNTLIIKGTNTITSQYGSAIGVPFYASLMITADSDNTNSILNAYSSDTSIAAIGNGYNQIHGRINIVNVTINTNNSLPGSYHHNSESSSNSNGSSSSVDIKTESVVSTLQTHPDQPITATAYVTATAGVNGIASVSVPEKTVTDAIAKAQVDAKIQEGTSNGVSVNLNFIMPKDSASLTATLFRNSLNDLVKAGVSTLEINSSSINVSFDLKALQEIQKQSNGNMTITINPVKSLSSGAATMIGTRPVYDITVRSIKDGKTVTISSFNDGGAIISIPYTPGKYESGTYLYGVYVDTKGNPSLVAGSAYDADTGTIIIPTGHLSVYGVGYTNPAAKFTDISSHWGKDDIDYVVGRGLFSGVSDNTFAPNNTMTRGMLLTVLGRLSNVDTKLHTSNSFIDVKADNTYRPYIEWAYQENIIQGIGNGKFEPNRTVTREEIAMIFANYAKATGYSLPIAREEKTYADVCDISDLYINSVKIMQQAGIMMGNTENRFNPKSSATRTEVSSMLHRYINLTIDPHTAQGWTLNDAGQYLYYKDGHILTGTQTIDSVKYFFETTGILKTCWVKDGDNWRYYSGNKMLIGWKDFESNDNKKTYYFTKDGIMVSEKWIQIDSKWYYFYHDGSLAVNAKIDGYKIDGNGVRKSQ
ncbi:S-layer homology domain-containing protein [Anaerovorax odorimutans]|uniref:S-layer homology domain-containing protein n=1 Tax=Anaerovorax odorimutans TaxID=109327 RepID=UPI000422682C|nr:S-layer homology domain-containing protein [Anaerovorax odorimutans]